MKEPRTKEAGSEARSKFVKKGLKTPALRLLTESRKVDCEMRRPLTSVRGSLQTGQ
jgi:hypothetical protein